MSQLRAFAICPTCSDLYPSYRGCPRCDDPLNAVAAVAEPTPTATPVAISRFADPDARAAAVAAATRSPAPLLALLSLGVVVATGLLVALLVVA